MCVLMKGSSHTELQTSSGEVHRRKSEQKRPKNHNKTAQKCSVSSENTEK